MSRDNWLEQLFCPKLYDCTGEYPGFDKPSIDPSTVGEYTGLKDKNEREIYEGDIVKRKGFYPDYEKEFKCVITWNGAGWKAMKPIGIHSVADWPLSTPGIIEVIGNIHDNPELLKE